MQRERVREWEKWERVRVKERSGRRERGREKGRGE